MALDRDLIVQALPAYEVGEELGRGGCGIVLAGVHRSLHREVAIKQLPRAFGADPDQRQRFVAEARLLGSFDHPHIVPIFDYVEYEGVCMLVMEHLTGGTVWDRMRSGGLSAPEACAIVLATCAGLHYAHQKDTLHRDIKPENLMFSSSGTLKITDFGIAKVMGSMTMASATQAGYVVGTPAYIAPEQAQSGELSPGTDVYALGTVLFEMLSKQLPYEEVTDQVVFLYQHVHEDPAPLGTVAPTVPGPIASVVDGAIQRDPLNRFRTAEDFGMALAGAATEAWGSGWLDETGVSVMGASRMLRSVDTGRHRAVTPAAGTAPVPPPAAAADDALAPTAPLSAPANHAPAPATRAARAVVPPTAAEPAEPSPAGLPSAPRAGRNRGVLIGIAVVVIGAIVALAVAMSGGGGDDDPEAATTTTTSTSTTTSPASPTLAASLAIGSADLPAGYSEVQGPRLVPGDAPQDPCLAGLPLRYPVLLDGGAYAGPVAGLEVASVVGLTDTPEDAAANADGMRSDAFLDCVDENTETATAEQVDRVSVERAPSLDVEGYVTSWVIEAGVGDAVAFSESIVLSQGRAVVIVHLRSASTRFDPDLRSALVRTVSARLSTSGA